MSISHAIVMFQFGFSAALATTLTAATNITLIDSTTRNGSFENGTGNTVITDWEIGHGVGETQRLNNNASHGGWTLVVGQTPGNPNLGASCNTDHQAITGDSFDLSFKWLPKSLWDTTDQINWQLFTTSDNTISGTVNVIASGNVSGFANGSAYQTSTIPSITGVSAINEGQTVWLQFKRGSSSTSEFARIDEVSLSVTTDSTPTYVSLDPANLTTYYPFEGTTLDHSHSNPMHDGSWTSGEAYNTGIIDSQCADFTASNASIGIPHTLEKNFTLSFWFKASSSAPSGSQWTDGSGIIDGSIGGVTNDLGISLLGSKIAFGVGNPDTTILSQSSVSDGAWHHVVLQRHNVSGTLRVFVDGTLETETVGPAGDRDISNGLIIGSLQSDSGFLSGCLDDVRIFSSLLNEASIAKLHTSRGDYDDDKQSDLTELIAVTNWNDGASRFIPHSTARLVGSNPFTLTIDAKAGRTYTLQKNTNLLSGTWQPASTAVTPDYHGLLDLTDPSTPNEKTFYRMQVTGRGPATEKRPNIVIIYGDDVGYGDVGAYNAGSLIPTPNIDQLATEGLRFTNGYCSASTCSPSRFSMLTGVFAFREGVSIIPPTGALSIDPSTYTLPDMLKEVGYNTAVIGKWHLGIGNGGTNINWNGNITPGPLEIGFDTCFMIPTTNDRVPCVYLKDHNIVGLDSVNDPLYVHNNSYAAVNIPGSTQYPINDPVHMTYYPSSNGHNHSIINGIGRIGYMSGGQSALWDDETMAQTFLQKAKDFINAQDGETPFLLYFASADIHVPRAPHPDFQGTTTLGFRGDAMVQFDWVAGQINQALKDAGLEDDTIVIFSSDNGPVYDDGYQDGTTVHLYTQEVDNGHDASGVVRGGKYSILEGGTRVPLIVKWPAKIQPGSVSDALVNQVDFMASFANLLGVQLPNGSARDSRNAMDALLGTDPTGLPFTVIQNNNGGIKAIRVGSMKYTSQGRLYDLSTDIGEQTDLSASQPTVAATMAQQLADIVNGSGIRN